MIQVTRLNHEALIVNSDLIELIEVTPDTVLTLTTGKKIMVRESAEQVLGLVMDYREHVGRRVAHAGMTAHNLRDIDEDSE